MHRAAYEGGGLQCSSELHSSQARNPSPFTSPNKHVHPKSQNSYRKSPMSPPIPRLSSPSSSFSQITYDFSHAHIYCSKFYPRPLTSRPSALSEVLVVGHESGLQILWRRPIQKEKDGDGDDDGDDGMVLDGAEGGGEEEQSGDDKFACEYNVYLGTPVYSISFPPASVFPTEGSTWEEKSETEDELLKSLPGALLGRNMLVAAACGDRTVRLITLPLAPPPPSPAEKKYEHIVTLGGGASGHREPAGQISVSIIPSASADNDYSPATSPDSSPYASGFSYASPRRHSAGGWDVVIASSSPDTSGTLLLWRVSLRPPARNSSLPVTFKPQHRPVSLFLQSPTTALAFNTSSASLSRRHQLLISDRKGAVRILDTKSASWLCSFYTPYSQITERRKKVLGAEWCTGGRSVVVLCEDGEWGIWDLEGVLAGEKSHSTVVTGFLVGGMVGETWYNSTAATKNKRSYYNHLRSDDGTSAPSSAKASSIVSATTASSRHRRQSGSLRPEDRIGLAGHLSVTPIPSSSFLPTPATLSKGKSTTGMGSLQIPDEIVTMVFGSVILSLPSLQKFWKSQLPKIKKRATAAGANGSGSVSGSFNSISWNGGEDGKTEKEFLVLEGWDTNGASVTSLDVIVPPLPTPPTTTTSSSSSTTQQPNPADKNAKLARILLCTTCRVVLVDAAGESLLFADKKRKGGGILVGQARTKKSGPPAGTFANGERYVMRGGHFPKTTAAAVAGGDSVGGEGDGSGTGGKGKRKVGFT